MNQTSNLINQLTEWDRLLKVATVEAVRRICAENRRKVFEILAAERADHHQVMLSRLIPDVDQR